MTALVLLIQAALAAGTAHAGRPPVDNGGKANVDASLSRSVSMFGQGTHTCSGTWLTPRIMVTSGHCEKNASFPKIDLNGKTPIRVIGKRFDPRWKAENGLPDSRHDLGIVMVEAADCRPLDVQPVRLQDREPEGLRYENATVTGYGDTTTWFDQKREQWIGDMNTEFKSGAVNLHRCTIPSQALAPEFVPGLVQALKESEPIPLSENTYFLSHSERKIRGTHALSADGKRVESRYEQQLTEARLQLGDSGGGVFAHDRDGNPVLVGVNSFQGENRETQARLGEGKSASRLELNELDALALDFRKPGSELLAPEFLKFDPKSRSRALKLGLKVHTQTQSDHFSVYTPIYTPENLKLLKRWIQELEAEYSEKSQCAGAKSGKIDS